MNRIELGQDVRFVGLLWRQKCFNGIYYTDSSVLSNVPNVINFGNSHCEINSVISISRFLPPKSHTFDINPPITGFQITIENIDKL